MIVTHIYQPDRGIIRREGIEAFDELLRSQNQVFWVDFYDPTDEESYVLKADFNFHPLAIEDVIAELPGPKVDDYGQYLFVVFKVADYQSGTDGLTFREIDIFLLRNGVVTIHYDTLKPLDAVTRRCQSDERVLSRGADFMFHTILDHIVDHYDQTVERIEDEVDVVEDGVFGEADIRGPAKRAYVIRRDLSQLRRIAAPQREILSRFARDKSPLIGTQAQLYFRDVFDHMLRIVETVDWLRDTLAHLLEVHYGFAQKELNDKMKVLTVIATVSLPVVALASIYGMNFEMIPEFKWKYGYLWFWGLSGVATLAMFLFLKKRKWY